MLRMEYGRGAFQQLSPTRQVVPDHRLSQPAAAGLRGNGERMRKWRASGHGERDFLHLHFLSFSLFPLISSQFTTFLASVAKILTYAL